jgi:diphosphomevalonate decarboxylase
MMMVSPMHYILMEPNTLAIIQKIWTFRKETHLPLCFTLDAGANVHLLYDSREEDKIINFVENELLPLCSQKQYFCSNLGGNPIKLSTIEK